MRVRTSTGIGFQWQGLFVALHEPLLDDRIVDIVKLAKRYFSYVMFCSNADFLTENVASELDGNIDFIGFTLYMNEPNRNKRAAWIRSLFNTTQLDIANSEVRMITHFSPLADIAQLSQKYSNNPCYNPQKRMIVNHRGEMLLCCDDLVGNFKLGTVFEHSISELWFSEEHQRYVTTLTNQGGRKCHSHCMSCPRQ